MVRPEAASRWREDPVQQRTCEVRWIRRGSVESGVAGWFGRFSPVVEMRDDDYLVNPLLTGLSVKIRGQASFEVKLHRGVVGPLEIDGRVAGVITSWLKLSYPLDGAAHWLPGVEAGDWRRVHKHRRISYLAAAEPPQSSGETCSVELTEVETFGDVWWTIALEAGGRDPLAAIRRTAATVFAEPLPTVRPLGVDEATSYAEWIRCIDPQRLV
jgi:hypothetical protein